MNYHYQNSTNKLNNVSVNGPRNMSDLNGIAAGSTLSTFHSHCSGSKNGYNFVQEPSKTDISNAANRGGLKYNNYVFGMRNNTVYIYNGNGVLATMPIQSSFNLGK